VPPAHHRATANSWKIAKALAFDARVIVMDEPSAALTSHEVERLFEIIPTCAGTALHHLHQPSLDEIFTTPIASPCCATARMSAKRPIGQLTRTDDRAHGRPASQG